MWYHMAYGHLVWVGIMCSSTGMQGETAGCSTAGQNRCQVEYTHMRNFCICVWGKGTEHTPPIILVVKGPLQQGSQLLEVLLGLVQGALEGADLLVLVRAPVRPIGEQEAAERIADCVGDRGQERADRVDAGIRRGGFVLVIVLPYVVVVVVIVVGVVVDGSRR